jgi:lysophospholipase L1-like esterase
VLLAAFTTLAWANTAVEPVPRDARWMSRHEGFVAIARQGGVDLLFLGDSITDFWRTTGKEVWAREYGPLNAANFGISADRTQHVLWRIEHGELDGIQPKVVVLLIGTNNTGLERDTHKPRNTPAEAIEGITAVVHAIQAKLPKTKILLLGLFPRADEVAPPPEQIGEINAAIAKLADGDRVRFLDIGPKLLQPDGTLSREIMPDLLHPNAKGYEIWAAAIKPSLDEMLK